MGGSGTSLGVGLDLVLRIELEFGVQSCVTQSCNTHCVICTSSTALLRVIISMYYVYSTE